MKKQRPPCIPIINVTKDPVEVYCRIRPYDEQEDEEPCICRINSSTVQLTAPESYNRYNNREQVYQFKYVFQTASTQQEVFDEVTKPLVTDLLAGKNGLLFAYGITGSGKTYTMEGTNEEPGIFRRTVDVIFKSISKYQTQKYVFKSDKMNGFDVQTEAEAAFELKRSKFQRMKYNLRKHANICNGSTKSVNSLSEVSCISSVEEDNGYAIFVTYVQIYNKYVYDLLDESREPQTKVVREDARHNLYIHDCTEVEVKNPQEAYKILLSGQKKRKVGYTNLNHESSRSHSVFTIRSVQAPFDAQGEEIMKDKQAIVISQLSLVDLAGSERTYKTKATGDRLKETGNINNSLMALRQCIEIMRENQIGGVCKKVPYRDCKLTHFFKNYLEGEGKVRMILCVNANASDYEETMPVMKFAEVASEVQIQRATLGRVHILGLTPGRRKANEIFKEAGRRLHESGTNICELQVDLSPVYNLGPVWPTDKFTEENFEETINKLVPFLKNRIKIKEKRKSELSEKVGKFRAILVNSEKESVNLRAHRERDARKIKDCEHQIRSLEAVNDSMTKKLNRYRLVVEGQNQRIHRHRRSKSDGSGPGINYEGNDEINIGASEVFRSRGDNVLSQKRGSDGTPKSSHNLPLSICTPRPVMNKRFRM